MAAQHKPLITVFGSLNIDLVSYVSHHPAPGETMTSNSFAVSPGGKGANQAVACAKLSRPQPTPAAAAAAVTNGTAAAVEEEESAHVRMVGAVGADSYGLLLRENMASRGVDVDGVVVRPAPAKTGIALIVVEEPTGQNRIILSPEANHSWGYVAEMQGGAAERLAVLGPRRPDLLIMQLEIPIPAVLATLEAAREGKVPVLLNPAPAVELPNGALAGLAHLVVNETEAAILSEREESELDTEAGMERVGKVFIEKGVKNVIITLGGRGVYYMSEGGQKKGLVPAVKAKVVDTTAAGDTFVGQYALEVVAGASFDIEAAVVKANKAAAKTVERLGAQDSIPWRDEL